jgi:SRSO17 transposase
MVEPREAVETVSFIDNYCAAYKHLFATARSYEAFKFLHLGMTSEIPRKTLPAIAKAVGLPNDQVLHHFLTESPWDVKSLRNQRLSLILQQLQGRSIVLVIDDTGDRKKGKTTDYVARQYIGNLGKIDNGIVSVNAYGVLAGMTFPLVFKVFKPQGRLKAQDTYKTKLQLAQAIIQELQAFGFKFELVLADSLYGECYPFISLLQQLELKFVMAIRSNHGVWMPSEQRVRYSRWKAFERIFSNGKSEVRYLQETLFGKRRTLRYWTITTDPVNLPENSTYFVMSSLPKALDKAVGNLYGLRTWVEYGFKQCKNQLGWADFRLTNYEQIECWWEVVSSTYLMVSLQFAGLDSGDNQDKGQQQAQLLDKFSQPPWWNQPKGWKHRLNNLQLIIQPYVYFCLIKPWLSVFDIPQLKVGFSRLTTMMNEFQGWMPTKEQLANLLFSSA